MNVLLALIFVPVGIIFGALLAANLAQVLGWSFLTAASLILVLPQPLDAIVQFALNSALVGSWFALLIVLILIVLLVFLGYAIASIGFTVPAVPMGLLVASPAERVGRGWLIGLNTGLNFALLVALLKLIPGGLLVAVALALINFLACIIVVSNIPVFQIILAYTSLFLPMSLPMNVAGIAIAAVNSVAWAFGTPLSVFPDWIRANFVMHGGIVHGCARTAYNVCNFSVAHPTMSRTDPWVNPGTPVWPFCNLLGVNPPGGFRTVTVDGAIFHEGCHTLNVAAFGWIYHLVGFVDQWLPMPWSGGARRGPNAHSELCAESGARGFQRNWLDMWGPSLAGVAVMNAHALSAVVVPAAPGVQEIPPVPSPFALAVDGAGNLFIAERDGNRIRRVEVGTGLITTVAGTGASGFSGDGGPAIAAQLSTPSGIAVDPAGNLFIADSDNHRVRRVAAATGFITTIAGTGTAAFSGDTGAATAADLSTPRGLAVDGAGNVFIADTGNNRVRRVAADGSIDTVAGNGTAAFSGDGGPATAAALSEPRDLLVDPAGDLLVADTGNNRIRLISAGAISTLAGSGVAGFGGDGGPATAAVLFEPSGLALDAAGNVLIADLGNNRIRRVVTATGTIDTFAGTGIAGFLGDGGAATVARLSGPSGVAVDGAGNLFIGDGGNARVRRVATTSTITTVLLQPGEIRIVSERNRAVTLDSTGSTDPDAFPMPLGRLWSLFGPPPASVAAVATPNAATLAFVPDVGGGYLLTLDITDGRDGGRAPGILEPLLCRLNVLEAVITVPAGPFSTAAPVTLTDTSAVLPPGTADPSTREWTFVTVPPGSALAATTGTVVDFTFTPDVGSAIYEVQLVVSQEVLPIDGGTPIALTDMVRVTLTVT